MSETDALEYAFKGMAEYLKKCMEYQNVSPDFTDSKSGNSLLKAACEADSSAVVSELLWCGADPNLEITITDPFSKVRFRDHATALSYAKSPEVAKLLLEHGADPNHVDKQGFTPFSHAALTRRVGVETLAVMYDHGADPTMVLKTKRGEVKLSDLVKEKIEEIENWDKNGVPEAQREFLWKFKEKYEFLKERESA